MSVQSSKRAWKLGCWWWEGRDPESIASSWTLSACPSGHSQAESSRLQVPRPQALITASMCLRVRRGRGPEAHQYLLPHVSAPESDGAEQSPQVGPQNPRHTTWIGGGKSGPLRAASVRPPLALSRSVAMGASTHPLSRGPADLTIYTDWPLSRICLPSRVGPVGLAVYTGSPVPSRGRESPASCSIQEKCPVLTSSPGSTHTHTHTLPPWG